jgi:isoquinoline 1-oxidoreductase beta subunit
VSLAPSAPPETLTATARFSGGKLEIWAPTQAPGLARAAAAAEIGLPERQVTIYPMLAIGGGYGRKLEMDAIRQAAIMTYQMGRPVQLIWSRLQDIHHDRFRPAAMAQLDGRLAPSGMIAGWRARIAAPATSQEVADRIGLGTRLFGGSRTPVAGAVHPTPSRTWRSPMSPPTSASRPACGVRARSATRPSSPKASSTSSPAALGLEPFSFRIQLLGQNPRLANVLTMATASGGWDGGPTGSGMGPGGAERVRLPHRHAGGGGDCRRPKRAGAARGLCGGLRPGGQSGAGAPADRGRPDPRHRRRSGTRADASRTGCRWPARSAISALPTLASAPSVTVELVTSDAEPGGITELAVPTAAPAIANALQALTGERVRRLPLNIGSRSEPTA